MKKSTKENVRITVAALLTIPLVLGFFALLSWAGLDWHMWLSFGAGTASAFGYLIAMFAHDLRKPRAFLSLVLWIVVYGGAWFLILKSGFRISNLTYILEARGG